MSSESMRNDSPGNELAGNGAADAAVGTSPRRERRNLGRGLAALFGEERPAPPLPASAPATAGAPAERRPAGTRRIAVGQLGPSPLQPRRRFREEDLDALVKSIREQGILQPLLVRPAPGQGDRFEIIAGERRWRAAQLAQLHEVPVVVRELDDRQALEIALVENIQRQDLTPLEEAEGYRRLMEEFSHTQENLARAVGKSRSHIANMLRLLNLPGPVRAMVEEGTLSAGHARALLGAADPLALAQEVAAKGLNVRQTEKLAARGRDGGGPNGGRAAAAKPVPATPAKDADTLALEHELSNLLGLRVAIDLDGEDGALTVRFETLEQLDDIIARLRQTPKRAQETGPDTLDRASELN